MSSVPASAPAASTAPRVGAVEAVRTADMLLQIITRASTRAGLPQPRVHRAAAAGRIAEIRLPRAADSLQLRELVARLARAGHDVDERLAEGLRRRAGAGHALAHRGDDVLDADVLARAAEIDADPRRIDR